MGLHDCEPLPIAIEIADTLGMEYTLFCVSTAARFEDLCGNTHV